MHHIQVENIRIISGVADLERRVIIVHAEGVADGISMEYIGYRELNSPGLFEHHQMLDPDDIRRHGGEIISGDWHCKTS